MRDYHIKVFHREEDEGYTADIPGLRARSACGDTPRKALAELQVAREPWLEAARREGKPIPRPRYRPFIYKVPH